jgi:TonB family protein
MILNNKLIQKNCLKSIFTFALGLISFCVTSQDFKIVDVPKWVVEVPINKDSEVSKYDVNGGFYTQLYDYQIHIETEADFYHTRQKVVSTAGVSSVSEIQLVFDTSYQSLEFHYLYIWRGEKKIDKTADLSFEFLSNEENLQQKIYNGNLTAYDVLEDIRNGDVLEYAYTIYGDNPIFMENSQRLIPIADINPIDKFHLKLISSKENNFRHQFIGLEDSLITDTIVNGKRQITFEQENIKATDLEETTPLWILPYNYFNMSEFKNWKDVNDWALEVFRLKEEPNLDEAIEELFQGTETRDQKINKIIDYVQDEIRYMGIESGIGSIKPFNPEQVVKQRFGDCKDKSLLFVKLMNKIGIQEAYPVLVNTDFQEGVNTILEAGQNFNHCIATYIVDSIQYWIDPTIPLQGGNYKTLNNYDYGKALIIKESNEDLVKMNINDTLSGSKIIEELSIQSYAEPGTLNVVTKLTGMRADYIRSVIEYYSLKEISDNYKNQYSLLFPNIFENEKFRIEDDLEKNEFITYESYLIKEHWDGENPEYEGRWVIRYEPVAVYSYISSVSCEEKKHPVQFTFPNKFEQKTTINLPSKMNLDSEKLEKDNDAFDFTRSYELKNDTQIVIDYSFKSNSKEISSKGFQTVCADMNDITRNLSLSLYYPKVNILQTEDFQKIIKQYSKESKKKKRKQKKKNKDESIIPITKTTIDTIFEKSDTLVKTTTTLTHSPKPEKEEIIFTIVEEMPVFNGGNDSMFIYINNNLQFPEWEKQNKIEGTVYVSFVINREGGINDIKIIRSVENAKNFDQEVKRIITEMPQWTPGRQRGEKVSVRYTLPISFKL